MSFFSGRRVPAVIGGVAAFMLVVGFGPTSPAHADDAPASPVTASIPDATIVQSFGEQVGVNLTTDPGVEIILHQATLTLDATGLTGVATLVTAHTAAGTCATQGPIATCQLPAGVYYRSGAANAYLRGAPVATPGQSGTLKVTLADSGAAPVTTTSTVTIGERVDLDNAGWVEWSAEAPLGGHFTENAAVRNKGSNIINGVTLWLKASYAYGQDKEYSNCRYRGVTDMFCTFDTPLQPGYVYQLSEPLSFTVPLDATQPVWGPMGNGIFTWNTPADAIQDSNGIDPTTFRPGQGTTLGLVPMSQTPTSPPAPQSTTPQTDPDRNDQEEGVDLRISNPNGYDLVGVGAAVSGARGSTVTARLGVTNAGPGAFDRATQSVVTIPPGATAVSVPLPCYANIPGTDLKANQAKPGAQQYVCFTPDTVFAVGSTYSWDFGLRIDTYISDATGRVEANGEASTDLDATDDAAAIVVNPTSPDVWTGGAGISAPPVLVRDPSYSGMTRVFANSAGTVVGRGWEQFHGWWQWSKLGRVMTGTPAAFFNPDSRTVEVYANFGGDLVRYVMDGSAGPPNWIHLGSNMTGDPVVLYNANNHNIEVYANSAGHLVEIYYNAASKKWSGWNDFGGNITGKPAAFYNPNNHNIELYANSNGSLVEKYWQASNGAWSGWNSFGGNITGNPTAFYNPNNRNVELYANSNGSLVEKYWQASNGAWSGWNSFGGNITGDVAVYYNPENHNAEIYGVSNRRLVEKYWQASNGAWIGWNNL
jgi:hypothetical protein